MRKKVFQIVLILLLVMASASCADRLEGYNQETGYVYVRYGSYPQRIDGGIVGVPEQTWVWRSQYNKDHFTNLSLLNYEKEPILWRVLSVDDEKVFLCSEYVLFASSLNTDKGEYADVEGDFIYTDLHRLLNGDFYNYAFNEDEQKSILPDEYYGNVYLLSVDELKDKALGFGAESKRNAWSTEIAVRIYGTFVYQKDSKCASPYWTRTPSKNPGAGLRVKQGGKIGYYACMYDECGVRPVINLKRGSYTITAGTGTIEDPYILDAK